LNHREFEESFSIECMKLPLDRCKQLVRDSLPVALDLLIVNHKAEVLVGPATKSAGKRLAVRARVSGFPVADP
jgi:hypothetical protein